jgi:predicted molibdopterin-dependent oxidoreductase YjgC
MSDRTLEIFVDGRSVPARPGTTVASVLLAEGTVAFRLSERREARGPLCGMGICHECRVTIDGIAHQRACMVLVVSGMRVETATPSVASAEPPNHAARRR